jgi:hypothetical protein
MKKLIAALALTAMAVSTAQAASTPPCFSPAEIEAEQAMLFQTELMVVAETCHDQAYLTFLKRNIEPVKQYQHRLIEHFRRHGDKPAESALDSYLTRLANESSLRNGQVPVTTVCQRGATLFKTANALSPTDFRNYAAEKATINRQYYQSCK